MEKYEESSIISSELFGASIGSAVAQSKNLIDLVMSDNNNSNIDYSFFDIKGTVLFYGEPGTGKTTASHNIMKYALDKHGLDSYRINTADIIVPGLGESVRNFSSELKEFSSKDQGILFLDEIDRLCVKRSNFNEVSELKRMLVEIMQFFDSIDFKSHKIIIACTNVYNQLDDALLRRFSLRFKFTEPSFDEKEKFIRLCLKKIGFETDVCLKNSTKIESFKTIDEIKRKFREAILSNNVEKLINNLKEDI